MRIFYEVVQDSLNLKVFLRESFSSDVKIHECFSGRKLSRDIICESKRCYNNRHLRSSRIKNFLIIFSWSSFAFSSLCRAPHVLFILSIQDSFLKVFSSSVFSLSELFCSCTVVVVRVFDRSSWILNCVNDDAGFKRNFHETLTSRLSLSFILKVWEI